MSAQLFAQAVSEAPEDIALGLPRKMRHAALRDGRWKGVISRITKDALRITVRAVLTPRLDPYLPPGRRPVKRRSARVRGLLSASAQNYTATP